MPLPLTGVRGTATVATATTSIAMKTAAEPAVILAGKRSSASPFPEDGVSYPTEDGNPDRAADGAGEQVRPGDDTALIPSDDGSAGAKGGYSHQSHSEADDEASDHETVIGSVC
ncbi:hypothetical protein GCM10007382_07780 [Salinibacterium xinjiangense]|uniref:Uncharacterized protein n=1 Tax=Salinibacterium xinjiangense TaxID=386302 RepID=A0A2C8ZB44_9MICO|nr:hypothetical protein [Salinibacterium xinjiangense]GGK90177.1 hypothetical protein GCM10007382_07780 [Salinibacterium xinjiangense]SOE61363.1 hypothetical protein SAMN06296378_1252 [Salinibacterium xinjiangense]